MIDQHATQRRPQAPPKSAQHGATRVVRLGATARGPGTRQEDSSFPHDILTRCARPARSTPPNPRSPDEALPLALRPSSLVELLICWCTLPRREDAMRISNASGTGSLSDLSIRELLCDLTTLQDIVTADAVAIGYRSLPGGQARRSVLGKRERAITDELRRRRRH